MLSFINSLKNDLKSLKKRVVVFLLVGALFAVIGMIVISVLNVPVIIGSFRYFPGGAFRLFLCYLVSLLFFLLAGFAISVLYMNRFPCDQNAKKAITDLLISYVLRLLWIIVFFNYGHFAISLIISAASVVFLIFSLICSRRCCVISMLISCIMIILELTLFIFNVKTVVIY